MIENHIYLEFCGFRRPREGDDITDVLHTRYEQDQTLETETEASMGASTSTSPISLS